MGLFSKLFGPKSAPASETREQPSAPPFELAAEPAAAAAQCLDASAAIADALEDPRERAIVLARTAVVVAAGDDPLATMEAMTKAVQAGLEFGNLRWALDLIAQTLVTVRERELRARAKPMIDGLAKIVASVEDAEERAEMLPPLSLAQAVVGDVQGAQASAAAIGDPYFAEEARASVIQLLCELGELDHARAGLADLHEPASIGRSLKAIAVARLKAKQWDEAQEVARLIRTQPWRDGARADIASARAHRGEIEGALELAREIEDPESLGAALVDVAEVLAEKGEHERADELVAEIVDRQALCRGWRELAAIHAKGGDVPAAEARAQRIPEPAAFVEAMLQLADVPAVRASLEERERFLRAALAAAKKVDDPQGRYHRVLFARILSRAGNVDDAWTMLQRANAEDRAEVLDEIGFGLARDGHRSALESALNRPLPPFDRATLLLAAARALADRNN